MTGPFKGETKTFWIERDDGLMVSFEGVRCTTVETAIGPIVRIWKEGKVYPSHTLIGCVKHTGGDRRRVDRDLDHQVFSEGRISG